MSDNNQEIPIKSLHAQTSLLNQQVSTQTEIAPTTPSTSIYTKVTSNNKNIPLATAEKFIKQNQKPSTSLITPSNLWHAIHDVQVGTARKKLNGYIGPDGIYLVMLEKRPEFTLQSLALRYIRLVMATFISKPGKIGQVLRYVIKNKNLTKTT